MVSYNEKKTIARQNMNWGERKKAKKNIQKRNHPWYTTDKQAVLRLNQNNYQDISKEYLENE